jgi:hypothetical protein
VAWLLLLETSIISKALSIAFVVAMVAEAVRSESNLAFSFRDASDSRRRWEFISHSSIVVALSMALKDDNVSCRICSCEEL